MEKLFDEKRANADFLITLLGELSHRKMPRSRALKQRVIQALSVAKPEPEPEQGPFRMSSEQHRRKAADYRQQAADWTGEQREVAEKLARAHEALAQLIEDRMSNKP